MVSVIMRCLAFTQKGRHGLVINQWRAFGLFLRHYFDRPVRGQRGQGRRILLPGILLDESSVDAPSTGKSQPDCGQV
jgi:hypothetical protein